MGCYDVEPIGARHDGEQLDYGSSVFLSSYATIARAGAASVVGESHAS